MMNDDMNEDNQGGVKPTHNGGTVTSGSNTSCVRHNENESSQQNNNNLEVKKKAKLDDNNSSAPTSASSATALRRKSSNDNKQLSPSKSFSNNATNRNSLFTSSSSSSTLPRLGSPLPKDDRNYEQGSNNNNAASLLLDDDDNKECGLLQLAKKSRKKSSNRKNKSNPKPKLAHWLKNIAKDLASVDNGDDINDEEHYLAAQSSMKQRKRGIKNPSHSAGVYMAPPKSAHNNCENTIDKVSTKIWSDFSIEEKSTHFLTNIANDLSEISNISQAMKDGIMSLSTNTELNLQGPSVRQEGVVGFAKGHTKNRHVFTTSGGRSRDRIYLCYYNNILALTGILGTARSGGNIFPIYDFLESTKLPGSNRTVLDVIGSETTSASLMEVFQAHGGLKKSPSGGPHQRTGLPLLGLMITVSGKGRFPENDLGPQEAWEPWVESVKVYDEEKRTNEHFGFPATAASLENLVELKKEHLGVIVDYFNHSTRAISANAKAMIVAVYNPLRVDLREFGRQRQLSGIEETPSLQEVLPIVTESFARILVLSENAVTDSGMSFIAPIGSQLLDEIIGELDTAEKQALKVMISTGGFNCAIAPQSSHALVKAQITALIVVLKRFGFGDESVSPETRRSIIMGICKRLLVLFDSHTYVIHKLSNRYFPTVDNVLRWKWAIKMTRMTNMFSQEVWYKISTNLNRNDLPAVLLEEDEDE